MRRAPIRGTRIGKASGRQSRAWAGAKPAQVEAAKRETNPEREFEGVIFVDDEGGAKSMTENLAGEGFVSRGARLGPSSGGGRVSVQWPN